MVEDKIKIYSADADAAKIKNLILYSDVTFSFELLVYPYSIASQMN